MMRFGSDMGVRVPVCCETGGEWPVAGIAIKAGRTEGDDAVGDGRMLVRGGEAVERWKEVGW